MNKLYLLLLLCCGFTTANAQNLPEKPHILISSDIGGTDPDDNQSMTHLFMYSNLFHIEGLVSSFCVRIPLSYYLSRMPGADLFTIGLAVPASAAVSLIMCIIYYFCIRKKRLAAGKV